MSNSDLEICCKKLAKQVERSWSILYAVCIRLRGNPFDGSRDNFYASFGKYSTKTMAVIVEALMRKRVVVPVKNGQIVTGYYLDESAVEQIIAGAGPDPTRHNKTIARGKCGHLAVELYDGVCYGCHVRNMVNRQRKGKLRV